MAVREKTTGRSERGSTDPELMQRLAGGDLGALGALYDRYHEDVRSFLMHACAHGGDVDDLVHESFLTAARISPRYDGRASARPLMLGIAAQHAKRQRRAIARFTEKLTTLGNAVSEMFRRTPEDEAIA